MKKKLTIYHLNICILVVGLNEKELKREKERKQNPRNNDILR